ncbi:MAG: hypothetical protein NC347_13990 [Clostridium sp.]|nr:hypothetical protein [Clostridium sp.]
MIPQKKNKIYIKRITVTLCILLSAVFAAVIPSQAASKAVKAKKAYKEYLSNIMKQPDFREYAGLEFGSIFFAVLDISGDKVPELIVKESYTAPAGYWVYTYRNGKVKKLKEMNYYSGGEIEAVYPKKHIIKVYEGDDWDSDWIYYRVTGSKMKVAARTKNGKYYVNGKSVTKTSYQNYISKIEKTKCYRANSGKLKFRKNTGKNRKKYL